MTNKADKYDVDYMYAMGRKKCGNCAFLSSENEKECEIIDGDIDDNFICIEWIRPLKRSVQDLMGIKENE